MPPVIFFNAKDREDEKVASRHRDESALENGDVSREKLAADNGFFSSLNVAVASIRRRSLAL